MTETAFIWWTTKAEAEEIAAKVAGSDKLPERLKGAIFARARQTAEPQVFTGLVFGARRADIQWTAENPVCNDAIKRSGIVFPKAYAPFINDMGAGFVTTFAFQIVNTYDLTAEVEAEGYNDPASLTILEGLEPARPRAEGAIADGFKTVADVLYAFSDGLISEAEAIRILSLESRAELVEAMTGSEIPWPDDTTLTVEEAAAVLDTSVATVKHWFDLQFLPTLRRADVVALKAEIDEKAAILAEISREIESVEPPRRLTLEDLSEAERIEHDEFMAEIRESGRRPRTATEQELYEAARFFNDDGEARRSRWEGDDEEADEIERPKPTGPKF